jgi:hypothetical protein
MFAFICWWFPRTWAKGTAEDIREFEARRQQQRDMELAASAGESTTGDILSKEVEIGGKKISVPLVRNYVPPPIATY